MPEQNMIIYKFADLTCPRYFGSPLLLVNGNQAHMTLHPPSYHVIQGLKLLQMDFRLLDAAEAQAVRSQVIGKFASNGWGPIWHNFIHSASIQDANGWTRIEEYVAGTSFLLFFDETEDKSMIKFPVGTRLAPVLEECPGFEFYITNMETTYVLCFNDHDFLISVGAAMLWDLFDKTDKRLDGVQPPGEERNKPPLS